MRKIITTIILLAAGSVQPVLADDFSSMSVGSDQACDTIAKKCLAAGYEQREDADKKFWMDCMKPILLGKTVNGVTIEPATTKACLMNKIEKLKQELAEMQKAAGQQ